LCWNLDIPPALGSQNIPDKLGIPHERIYAVGSNKAKIDKIKELNIIKHYDNNSSVIKQLGNIGVQFKCEMSIDDEQQWLEYLENKGEKINPDLWDLVDESPVMDPEAELELGKYEFFKRFANPDEKSKDDKGIYLIRYRYAPLKTQNNSRQFCKDMVANGNMGVVYRREDIVQMGDDGINGQFSPKGKSNYSIHPLLPAIYG